MARGVKIKATMVLQALRPDSLTLSGEASNIVTVFQKVARRLNRRIKRNNRTSVIKH